MTRWISFLTDYGLADGFVAACHGVIAAIAPEARVLDVTHLVPPQDVRRGAAVLAETVTQNDAELRETPALFPPDHVAALTQKTRAALERVQPLLTARERDGLVRRCHGDLHLGNIVLIDDAPVLFDPEDRAEVELHGTGYTLLRERDLHAVAAGRLQDGSATGLYL